MLKEAILTEKAQAHVIHCLGEACICGKYKSVPKIECDYVLVGGIRPAAYSTCKPFWQFKDVEFQQNCQAQGKQTGIGSGIGHNDASSGFAIRCGYGCEDQRTMCNGTLGMGFIGE